MRPIKFRAWDKEKKRYHYFSGPVYDNEYDSLSFGQEYVGDEKWNRTELTMDFPVQQFTGLTDKNGKDEIYEGDLVKLDGSTYEVVWVPGGFQLKDTEKPSVMHLNCNGDYNKRLEIVGNKWES